MLRRQRTGATAALCASITVALFAPLSVMAAPSVWLEVDGNIAFDGASGASYDWGNSGAATPTASCPATGGVVNHSGSGGLFNCGSPGAGSAPPNPPALTAAAAADASILSNLFVADPVSSDSTTTCGSGDPTTFVGGKKNGDAIDTLGYTTGSVPAKDDLGNVYAVTHIKSNDHPEIFFGAERLVNNGDSHVDFEFLQSIVSAASPCTGTFSGYRAEGDLLIAVDFSMGGSVATTTTYQWHCNAEPGPQPVDGTRCDPAGSTPVPHYQSIAIPSAITVGVNAATIPCGGWVCRDKITGNSTQVATNDFMEGGIDLDALSFTGCYNTFAPHTRTAQPFTASLADFAGPAPLKTCRTSTTPTAPPTGATGESKTPGSLLLLAGLALLLLAVGSVFVRAPSTPQRLETVPQRVAAVTRLKRWRFSEATRRRAVAWRRSSPQPRTRRWRRRSPTPGGDLKRW